MRVDIVSDTICPWCYIGKRRFERALQARPTLQVSVRWRAFQLNPQMPVEGRDRKTYLIEKFGSEEQAGKIYEAVQQAGSAEGISFAFDRMVRTPNTVASHRLIYLAGEHGKQDDMTDVLFRGYFEEARDIGDPEVLVDLAAEGGLDGEEARAFLASDAGKQEVEAESAQASRLGIHGVPCFIFDGKYAVSGAQEPAVFQQVFDLMLQEPAQSA